MDFNWSSSYDIDVSQVPDGDVRSLLVFLARSTAYFAQEVERLQHHVDVAFGHASSGDAHAARVALTQARWGALGDRLAS